MTGKFLMTASAAVFSMLFALGAAAQTSGTGAAGVGPGASTGAGTAGTDTTTATIGVGRTDNEAITRHWADFQGEPVSVDNLREGMPVVSVSGNEAGTVAGVVGEDGELTDVVIQMDGLNSKRVAVKARTVKANGEMAAVAMTETELEGLPSYRE